MLFRRKGGWRGGGGEALCTETKPAPVKQSLASQKELVVSYLDVCTGFHPFWRKAFPGDGVVLFHSLNLYLYNAYGLQSFLDTNMSLSLILKRRERSYYNPLFACERTETQTAEGFLTAPAMLSPQQEQSTFRHRALTPVP